MTRQIAKESLKTTFNIATLPPTSSAAKYHNMRTYIQVQDWLGNKMNPLEWGWERKNNEFVPVLSDLPSAPDKLLNITSCNCKAGCKSRTACACLRHGNKCTAACGQCMGYTCYNSPAHAED